MAVSTSQLQQQEDYISWKRKLYRTRIIATILIFLYGVEDQSLAITFIFFFSQNFNMTRLQATFYYSMAETIFVFGNLISGAMFGRYIDRTRNLRFVFLLNLVVLILGNLMYSIPWHIWFVLLGRFLCGINESLQTAVCGEFRRCYNDDELINCLGWYEITYSIGINIGPGLPVLLSFIDIKIGWWKINKYNAIQVLVSMTTSVIFIISWFVVIDLSKELDLIKSNSDPSADGKETKYSKDDIADETKYSSYENVNNKPRNIKQNGETKSNFDMENCKDKCISQATRTDSVKDVNTVLKEKSNSNCSNLEIREENCENFGKPDENIILDETKEKTHCERKLMKWSELFNIDILSLCISYGFIRYAVGTVVAMVTIYAVNSFHWNSGTLSWLHVTVGFSSYGLITVLVHFKVFQGSTRIYYFYVISTIISCMLMSALLLPRASEITSLQGQIAFGACMMFVKCFVFFHSQSSGKFLLFNTVTHDNANFVDSYRSVIGNVFRIFGKCTFYYFYLYPEYFVSPMVSIGLFSSWILLYRRHVHLERSHKEK